MLYEKSVKGKSDLACLLATAHLPLEALSILPEQLDFARTFSIFNKTSKQRATQQRFNVHQAAERIEAQFAVGGWCVGAAMGFLRGMHAPGEQGLLIWTLAGILLTAGAGMLGCFAGYVGRLGLRTVRSRNKEQDDQGPELVASLALGTGIGGFLAGLVAVLAGAWETGPFAAAAGAFVLSALFTMTGDLVRVLIRMIALDSKAARRARPFLEDQTPETKTPDTRSQNLPSSQAPKKDRQKDQDWTKR